MNIALLFIIPVLFLGGVFSTMSGGGLGIIMVLLFSFYYPIHISIALSAILAFAIQIAKVANFRKAIRWNIVWWYAIPGIPVAYVAGFLLFLLPGRFLEIALGSLCTWAAFKEILPNILGRPLRVAPKKILLVLGGALNGFVAGAIGNGSLFRAPLLLAFGLRKEAFIGTSSVIAFIIGTGRTSAYVQEIPWTGDIILLIVLLLPLMFLSVAIGRQLLVYMSDRSFEILQAGIMVAGAVKLIFFPS